MSFPSNKRSRQWRERWSRWRRRLIHAVVTPWNTLVRGCSWFVRSIGHAWTTRHLRYMIQGLPAVFATIGAIVLGIGVLGQDRSNLAATYYMEASRALVNQSYDLARTYSEKAIELNGSLPEYRFFLVLALGLEADKKPEQAIHKRNHAFAIAKTLAPNDRTGYPPAHVWMGDFIARFAPVNEATMRMRENQYIRAYTGGLERDPKKFADAIKSSAERLARLYWFTQRPAEAEKYLRRGADDNPIFKVFLGEYYKAKKQNDESQRMFDSATEAFRNKLTSDIDDHESRLGLVQALVDQEKYDEALTELQSGLTHKPDDVRYTQGIALVLAAKENQLANQPGASLEDRLGFIQAGLQMMPTNHYLLGRLVQLTETKGEVGEKSKKIMQNMLADGRSAPILHFVLGRRAYTEGNLNDAKNHWEEAYRLDPKFAFVANNLAWIMVQPKDVDQKTLESALDIVNRAIKQVDTLPAIYGTRGEILFKMGRYQEAIPDLVNGVKQSSENIALHEMLVAAYEKVGNTTFAEIHRKKVDELRAKNVKPIMPDVKSNEIDKALSSPGETPATKDQPPSEKR